MTRSETPILHVDMDAFYASVEVRDDPSLAGRPVAVGGSAAGRGVIAAASYAARKFGVRSAMPTAEAQRLCPDLVLVAPSFEKYTAESRRINAIFLSYTPLVEPLSLDEAFLDVTGCELTGGDPLEIGRAIKRDILRETGLVASVGIASSKFIAKLASDMDKPDGFRVIRPSEVQSILAPLPVSSIYGVGPRTAKRLEAMGVRTVADLARQERAEVMRRFGASGAWIHDLAHGLDTRRVTPRREEKSYSQERTFQKDIQSREELRLRLLEFCEEIAFRLRNAGLRARTVSVKARYPSFKTLTRTQTMTFSTNVGVRFYGAARELLDRIPAGPLRLLGVSVSNLDDVRTPQQGMLFGSVAETPEPAPDVTPRPFSGDRLERVSPGLDRLRRKYGRGIVVPASLLGREATHGLDGTGPGASGNVRELQADDDRPGESEAPPRAELPPAD
ncbi:MAG: DNA polymerase IV [Planctomycetes bacterium]|nr:DNA polymerase IV [Planctomycetota bacterium]